MGWADTKPPAEADNRSLVLFDRGDELEVEAGDDGIRFLLVSGQPIEEPVAWYGPIVMNTQQQLREAFEDLEKGTFLKSKVKGASGSVLFCGSPANSWRPRAATSGKRTWCVQIWMAVNR